MVRNVPDLRLQRYAKVLELSQTACMEELIAPAQELAAKATRTGTGTSPANKLLPDLE